MSITHEERGRNEAAIFAYRTEAGVQEVRRWLYARRDGISDNWTEKTGDELLQLQGEARLVKKLIKLIDTGPTVVKQGEQK